MCGGVGRKELFQQQERPVRGRHPVDFKEKENSLRCAGRSPRVTQTKLPSLPSGHPITWRLSVMSNPAVMPYSSLSIEAGAGSLPVSLWGDSCHRRICIVPQDARHYFDSSGDDLGGGAPKKGISCL